MEIRISKDRILHMWGVAEYMHSHAKEHGLDPDKMYVLGLLHDIGYVDGANDHEWYGCRLMQRMGFKYTEEIRLHGQCIEDIFNSFRGMTPELKLLLEADLSVGLDGEYIGYDARLNGIGVRHGFDSQAYRVCKETVDWLTSEQ